MELFSVGQKSGLFLAWGAGRKESILGKKQNINWRVVGIQGWKPMNKGCIFHGIKIRISHEEKGKPFSSVHPHSLFV